MKVLIATGNPAKIEGAKRALLKYFDDVQIEGMPADSNVGKQPVNGEIYTGAKNRIKNLKEYSKMHGIKADLYLSVESGITNTLGRWMITHVAAIEDNLDFESYGTGPSFPVPDKYVKSIIDSDLSVVMNEIFVKDDDSYKKGGAIDILTHSKVSRIDLTEMSFIMALTKYINRDVWE